MSVKSRRYALGWFICFLGALFYCYEYLLRVSPAVMAKHLMSFYNLNAESFGNLSAYYYYIYVPMQLIVGLLFDRFGARRLLTLAVACCTVGIYVFALTQNITVAELGRLLMGFGSAFAFVGVLKLATVWLPPERFALVSGLSVALGMLGGILGDVSLSALVAHHGWRTTCTYAAVFGLLLTVIIFVVIRDHNPDITHEQSESQIHSVVLAWPELVKILTSSQVWVNGLIGCLLYLPLSAFAELWAIPYLKEAYNFSASHAAEASSLVFLGWACGGPIVGWLSDYIKQRRLLMTLGSMVSAVIMALILYMPNLDQSMIFMLLFLFGMFSSPQVLVFPVSREISSPLLTGTALALTNMVVMLGGFCVPVIGYLLDYSWGTHTVHKIVNGVHYFSVSDFQIALSILPIGLLLAAFATFFLKETHCQQIVTAEPHDHP